MDENMIPAETFRKIYSGEKCLEVSEVVTLFFNDTVTLRACFRIRWCNVNACYIAEYEDENGTPLVVDEMTKGHILAFFEDNFRIIHVLAMVTEKNFEIQESRLAFLEPTLVTLKKPSR